MANIQTTLDVFVVACRKQYLGKRLHLLPLLQIGKQHHVTLIHLLAAIDLCPTKTHTWTVSALWYPCHSNSLFTMQNRSQSGICETDLKTILTYGARLEYHRRWVYQALNWIPVMKILRNALN